MERIDRIEAGIIELQKSHAETEKIIMAGFTRLQKRQEKTDEQLAKTDAQLAKTDAQLAKTDAQLAKTDAQLAKTDAQLAKTDAQLAKTDAQLAKTDASIQALQKSHAETEAQVKETSRILSNIGFNLGIVAEEYFYHAMVDRPVLGGITFDTVEANIKSRTKTAEDEFDIVMYNGDSIGLIEIKHKVHPSDLVTLTTQKVQNFRSLFPDYKDYKIYLGIAGMSVPEEVAKQAQSKGIAVLRQKGEVTEISDKHLTAY
ncbi:MAG: hypothetical protein NW207_02885 [Cytophagales bacterium]|nr:hypothetical protein [Cytophagales bacterium]